MGVRRLRHIVCVIAGRSALFGRMIVICFAGQATKGFPAVIRAVAEWTNDTEEQFWASASMSLPRHAKAIVVLAHHEALSPENQVRKQIAEHLSGHQLATCTVGLTNPDEHVAGQMILDAETLAERLRGVVAFLANCDGTCKLPVALFGEDYCGAAAMMVAAEGHDCVKVAGAYCGRPELARIYLPRVRAATLLVVPGLDRELLEGNERPSASWCAQVRSR